jgi:uncharacterized repeat protein (TIGR01451 family)
VTQASFTRWLGLLFGLLLLCAGLPARADTPISLFQSFRGNVNFVGTEETIRFKDNKKPCMLVNKGVSAILQGIPSGAVIKSAQLYWAGSGTTPDYKVTFDGVSINAPAERQYVARSGANNTGNTYFGGAADVTTQVAKKGNGTYTFSGLSVDNGDPWCAVQGVVGGFALVVVYSHPGEPFRMLNLYEGFQDFQNTSLKITLGDFNVPNPLPANVTGRVGHITWEGDSTLSQGGEDLLFNDYEMTDKLNPKGNQFNSASNVTGDTTSYGIDFDIYTLTSPVIQPGQSTATTTYKSGQDLVILSSEIVAMPYVANADLSLAMTRTGELTVGGTTNYTLSVANGGIDDEMGPVTVVDTLPAGLKLVSAGGTGWTCSSVASATQTVVTCTQPGPLKSGAKMTPLVIAVSPTAAGSYTNTATVSGKTGDNNSANNTASSTSSSTTFNSPVFVFTKEICNANDNIVIAEKDTGCHRFIGPVTAGDSGAKIYITGVKNGPAGLVAGAPGANPSKVNLRFICLPNAGNVPITYAGQPFDCQGATWTDVSIKFVGGSPTAVLNDTAGTSLAPFSYADVGRVTVSMRLNTSLMDTVNFISKPQYLSLESVYRSERSDDIYADTLGGIGDNWAKPDIGFARAGEQFAMRICARMANANANTSTNPKASCAPSFGKEEAALGGVLPPDTLAFNFELDLFAVNLKGTPKLPIADKDQVVRDAFLLEQPFKRVTTAPDTNMFEARARYFEAGMLGMTVRLPDYLGAGAVTGSNGSAKENGRLVTGTRVVGRFYPDHFVTETTSNFQCLPPMNCPSAAGVAVTGATYSMQPFAFSVRAFGMPRPGSSEPTLLSLYQNMIIDPDKPRPLILIGAKAPNVSQEAAGRFDTDPATQLKPPAAADDFPDLGGLASWRLGDPYSSANRAGNAWGAPAPVYLRASMDEFRGGSATVQKVTSQTPTTAAAGTQYEDGLMVIAGRLFVPNVFGSELLRLPVPLTAQYWSGTAWVTSANDNASVVASAIRPVADGCRKFFAQDPKTGTCKANPLTPVAGGMPVTLVRGNGMLTLLAPARGTVGSVDYTLDSSAAPWLPSTRARATFGLYRSPVIYLREVY